MSEIKHTPTPWTKDRHEQLRGADGRAVNVWGLGIGWASRDDETEGNSELIIDAVNSHASLTAERDRLREIEDAILACEVGYQITDVLANYRKIRRDIQDRRAALSPVEESK
jgi:hypothetical protein